MIVRKLDSNGDIKFGHGRSDYLVDAAEAVVQNVKTRLMLWQGQWFIDTSEGTPWLQSILGKKDAIDQVIKNRILNTPGVDKIEEFQAVLAPDSRTLMISAEISTRYGDANLQDEVSL